jgi:hypothetical protein
VSTAGINASRVALKIFGQGDLLTRGNLELSARVHKPMNKRATYDPLAEASGYDISFVPIQTSARMTP